jgi:hypothetical protein
VISKKELEKARLALELAKARVMPEVRELDSLEDLVLLENDRLYHNSYGYSNEAHGILFQTKEFALKLMEEHGSHSAIEIAGLMHGAIANAQSSISIRRRFE